LKQTSIEVPIAIIDQMKTKKKRKEKKEKRKSTGIGCV